MPDLPAYPLSIEERHALEAWAVAQGIAWNYPLFDHGGSRWGAELIGPDGTKLYTGPMLGCEAFLAGMLWGDREHHKTWCVGEPDHYPETSGNALRDYLSRPDRASERTAAHDDARGERDR